MRINAECNGIEAVLVPALAAMIPTTMVIAAFVPTSEIMLAAALAYKFFGFTQMLQGPGYVVRAYPVGQLPHKKPDEVGSHVLPHSPSQLAFG
jgi:hypothetical protein